MHDDRTVEVRQVYTTESTPHSKQRLVVCMPFAMDWPGVRQVPEGSGEQGKIEKTGCEIICGTPTTLAVEGLSLIHI